MLMPAPIYYAHRLVRAPGRSCASDGRLPWLRPDAKSQVTMRYVDGKPHIDRHRGALHASTRPSMSLGDKMSRSSTRR